MLWTIPQRSTIIAYRGVIRKLLMHFPGTFLLSFHPREGKQIMSLKRKTLWFFRWPYKVTHFLGGPDSKESACNARDIGLIPGSGKFPGEGNGYTLQYSCLENSINRGPWWAPWGLNESMGLQRVGHNWVTLSLSTKSNIPLEHCWYSFPLCHLTPNLSVTWEHLSIWI